MSPGDYRGRLLRNLRITRLVFGLSLSALATVVWLRIDVPQVWPSLLGAVRVDTVQPNSLMDNSDSSSSSAMDHAGCLGRLQQYRYRKREFQFPATQPLATALAKYTRMLSHCGYNSDEDDVVRPGCRYVVYYEGWEGLGNRLLSLVTAFTYALLTNRALLTVENRGHLAELLCEPFPNRGNATWVLPGRILNAILVQSVSLDDAVEAQFVNVTAVRVNLRHSQPAEVGTFFCPEAQRGLQTVQWVIWESNQYYVPRLFMLPEFWTTLRRWFPDASRVFTHLGRVLCVPRNPVWETIRGVHEAEMARAQLRVGVQVRRHGVSDNSSTFSEAVYARIVECVEDVVPKRGTRVVVLVTSLQSVYWQTLRERWDGSSEVKFVMLSSEGTEQYSYEQARMAMGEIWLLSFCNTALATSGWSTFGYVAQALAGIRPRILNIRGGGHPTETEPACSRGQSPEPCLHYPFTNAEVVSSSACPLGSAAIASRTSASNRSSTSGLHKAHARWVSRHIRSCQDETHGLQLVSL